MFKIKIDNIINIRLKSVKCLLTPSITENRHPKLTLDFHRKCMPHQDCTEIKTKTNMFVSCSFSCFKYAYQSSTGNVTQAPYVCGRARLCGWVSAYVCVCV